MIYYLISSNYIPLMTFISVIFAFALTCVAINFGKESLPRDGGRAYAINGKLSAGKPRGAGIIFILTFVLSCLIFIPVNAERIIYLILVLAAMLTGYLDDSSKTPWGELKKGILDFIIALMVALTFLNFNESVISIPFTDMMVSIPPVVFGILAIILVWASINVTNCTDGVDGLCGTVSAVTLMSIFGIMLIFDCEIYTRHMILLMVVSILGYLWFNASPSRLLMGDAGSRAIGLFIAIAILKTGSPLLYLIVAIVLIIDGGLGLIKLTLIRVLKINVMKNLRTPIHDHMRKNCGWSDAQVVFRFAIIQIMISVALLYALMM